MTLKKSLIALMSLLLCIGFVVVASDDTTQPTLVVIAGSFQASLGCDEDWQPGCEATALVYDAEDDVWQASFELAAGDYEYKAALNGTWDENYGANAAAGGDNISLSLTEAAVVQFFYDHKTHWVTDDVNSTIIVAIGDFQSELGCDEDDAPDCLRSWLQDEDGNGVYSFATTAIPVGNYAARVALNQSMDEVYGAGGELNGDPIAFEVPTEGMKTTIGFSPSRQLLNVRVSDPAQVAAPAVQPTAVVERLTGLFVTAPGSYQSEIGCPEDLGASGDWAPDCNLSLMTDDDSDGIYMITLASIPAGDYEVKVAIGGSWSENYGADGARDGANIPFTVPVDFAQVVLAWDSATRILAITIDGSVIGAPSAASGSVPIVVPVAAEAQPDQVVIPGTLQSVLGCEGDWQPDCAATALTFSEEDGIWQGAFDIPAGSYEYKVAINGTWDENYGGNADAGGPNIVLNLAEDTTVRFYYDHTTHWVADSSRNVIATAPGSFQDEIGCPGDWQPDCLRSWLQDPDGDGLYVFATDAIPAGDYEVKVALNESWTDNYGLDGVKDGPNIPFTVPEDGTPVALVYNTSSNIMLVGVGTMPMTGPVAVTPDLSSQRAYWVTRDTIAWDIAVPEGATAKLYYAPEAGMTGDASGFADGTAIDLTWDENGLSDEVVQRFPHLAGYTAFRIGADSLDLVPGLVRMQVGIALLDANGQALDGTGLQIPGVLDDLFRYEGELGISFTDGVPTLRVWAPTAQRVRLRLFDNANPDAQPETVRMDFDRATGVWSVTGDASWVGKFYLYDVRVYAPSTQRIENNLVTDPYSISLALNSTRSQIVDLNDPAYMPDGWLELEKPALAAPEDIVLYELHVRDFSITDETVPEALRGTFKAFTVTDSNGMQHLTALAQAGLTHIHLLPAFDIATINEDASQRTEPDAAALAALPPDSEEQQAIIDPIRDLDGFNWGYDPYHFNVPEGSYSTDPNGPTRVLEFREMVQALSQAGLRVVMDVVYNHTNASGQSDRSVLDKIVPGYYHRLNGRGKVETSTCCQNTATEHYMMERLMIDSVVLWATAYKVDGYRFDLMGHHMRANMENVRAALDGLTPEADGVDGSQIYVYGEGWNFGEVQDNARGVNATQLNMGGTGIGTFNDRLRDAVRGGSPFGGWQDQGFAAGLYVDPNGLTQGTPEEQLARIRLFQDQIRVGLAGNLRDYTFMGANGEMVTGSEVLYNGSPAGYTLDPQEHIIYISAHDNETIFDAIQMKAPATASIAERARMIQLGNAVVMFSQGIPFFHAGDELLRSKSGDRNSYNSGDWFNRLDFTYSSNNWGVGLPPAGANRENYEILQPLLANPDLIPTPEVITATLNVFREQLQIRKDSPLFRLQTAEAVQQRVSFLNTGVDQQPGLIVMVLADDGDLADLDPKYEKIVVIFNASPEAIEFSDAMLNDGTYILHPILSESSDPIVRSASFGDGIFSVPGRSYAVFVMPQ